MSDLNNKLVKIQKELKAPKGQYNKFAKFKYRSAEDILEAAKPLCHAEDLALLLSDGVVNIGNFNYIVATAILLDGTNEIKVTAYAREEETKKGMDAAQITGSASSYARKYALNGLFAIDDTKDADSHDNSKQVPTVTKIDNRPTKKQLQELQMVMSELDIIPEDNSDFFQDAIGKYKPSSKEDFSKAIQFGYDRLSDKRESTTHDSKSDQ